MNIINAFIFQLDKDKGDKQIINKYKKFVKDKKKQKEENEQNNIVNGKIITDPNIKTLDEYKIMLSDYTKLPKKVSRTVKGDEKQKLFNYKYWVVANLYVTQNHTRRVLDYAKMKLAQKISDTTDKSFNYYILSNKTFEFNVYKTVGVHKQQRTKVTNELAQILKEYIFKEDIQNGYLMFSNEMYINRALHAVFNDTVNQLRKARTNDNLKDDRSKQAIIRSAKNMQHSVNTEIINYLLQ